jgi:hypothetical protein
LSEEKKRQVIALGHLGWSLRRIQKATGIRRETAATYLREAGVELRPPGRWGRAAPAKPANEVTPDSGGATPANAVEEAAADLDLPKPANEAPPDPGGATPADAVEEVGANPEPPKPANGVTPDSRPGKPPDEAEWAAPYFSEESAGAAEAQPAPEPGRSPSASACEAHRDVIEVGLSRGRNAKAIWQNLVDACGFAGGYQSVKRFVRKLRGKLSPEACAVIETAPGEEAQVDYGTGPMVRHPDCGKYRRTRLFVLTLGCSRKAIRLLAFRSSSQTWAELHEKAFRRLGGVTRTVVPDFVPGHKIGILWRAALCGCGVQDPRNMGLSGKFGAHNGSALAHHGFPFGISERRLSCSNATSSSRQRSIASEAAG